MKKIIRFTAFMCAIVGASFLVTNAQINPAGNVNVPFSFTAGTQTFEAGDYNVSIVKSGSSATVKLHRLGSKEVGTVLLQEFRSETSDGLDLIFGEESGIKYLAGITASNTRYLLLGGPKQAVEALTRVNKQNTRSKI